MNQTYPLNISFNNLLFSIERDPFYGLENIATMSIINNIYKENSEFILFQQFRNQFALGPFISDHPRHLIYLWCGLLKLPVYRNGSAVHSQSINFLETTSEKNFEIQLVELKTFLRNNSLPLPVDFFPDEPDNTKRKIELDEEEYNRAFEDIVVLLPKLEKELIELKNTPVTSMAERKQKLDEISKLEFQIKAIHTGEKINEEDISSTKPAWINTARTYAYELLKKEPSLKVKELTNLVHKHLKKENIVGRGKREISTENIRRNALAGIKS